MCGNDLQTNLHVEYKAYFCINAFKIHREKLFNKMDLLIKNRKDPQDKINHTMGSNDFCSFLLQPSDEWHRFTTEKVKQSSEQTHQKVVQLLDFKCIDFLNEFKIFSQKLVCINETKDFLKHVLIWVTQVIAYFYQDYKQLTQLSMIKILIKWSDRIILFILKRNLLLPK